MKNPRAIGPTIERHVKETGKRPTSAFEMGFKRTPVDPDSVLEVRTPTEDDLHATRAQRGALHRIAEEASRAVDDPTAPNSLKRIRKTGKPRGNPDFVPGHDLNLHEGKAAKKNNRGGKVAGTPNAAPRILKELIFVAMDMVGRDGRGKDKAAGYLARLALRKPELFSRLLEKLLPYTLTGAGGGPVQVTYDSAEEIARRMKERNLPVPRSMMTAPDNLMSDGKPRLVPFKGGLTEAAIDSDDLEYAAAEAIVGQTFGDPKADAALKVVADAAQQIVEDDEAMRSAAE